MRTFLTALMMILFFAFGLNAKVGFKPDRKGTMPDISNPQSVAAYMKRNLRDVKGGEHFKIFALTDKRITTSTKETRDELDGEYGDWYIERKTEFTFNDAGLLTEMYEYMANEETSELDLFIKVELGYNDNNEIESQTVFLYIKEMATFMEFMKSEVSYNSDGSLHETVTYQLDFMSMQWILFQRVSYEYTDGKLTEENNFQIDEETGELVNDFYIEYFYDNSGFIESSYEYSLSEATGEMMPSEEKYYTTDATGKVIEIEEYIWNPENEDWDISENILLEYDGNGNPSEELFKWGDAFSGEFIDSQKTEYSYANENYDEYLMPVKLYFNPIYSENIVNVPTGNLEYWFDGEDWNLEYKTTYEYSNGLSSVTENINSNFKLYPNPASDVLYFTTDEMFFNSQIEIFSLTGTKLISTELSNYKDINVSNLPVGLYIYNIELDGKQFSGKIIIQ